MSVTTPATTLLRLRDAARAPDAATRPAHALVDTEYVAVLSSHYGKRLWPNPAAPP